MTTDTNPLQERIEHELEAMFDVPRSLRLPTDVDERLSRLAAATGRPKSYYLRELVTGGIDDLEYAYGIAARAEAIRDGNRETRPLDELMSEMGVSREALDGLADAEHRATRAEAQSAIRGRAVAIYQRRAREAEAERDWNWRSSRHSKIERIKANARADRAEAEARAQRRRADDMEDNALRAQTNLRAAEERADEWRQATLEESAAQPRPLMHETPPAITLSRIRQLTYNAKRRNETIRPDQILAILERRKA